MAFSETNFPSSREQIQTSGANPNVAMVMCQSLEGKKLRGIFFRRLLSSRSAVIAGSESRRVFRRREGIKPTLPFRLADSKPGM